jgi:hypothetical protein
MRKRTKMKYENAVIGKVDEIVRYLPDNLTVTFPPVKRSSGSFENLGFFLDDNFGTWKIIRDELKQLVLICIKKDE